MKVFLLTCSIFFLFSQKINSQVINEIRINPSAGQNSIGTVAGTSIGNEFIEIYNPTCAPLDISCYFLAGNNGPGGDPKSNWTLRFPAGTIIPSLGFLVVAGDDVAGLNLLKPNTLVLAGAWDDINFTAEDQAITWLMNGNDWKALYDADGTPLDLVAWGFAVDDISDISTMAEYDNNPLPLNRASCPNVATLATAKEIFDGNLAPVAFLDGIGVGYWKRTVDAGNTWVFDPQQANVTIGSCNGICATSSNFNLNATIQSASCANNDGQISFAPTPGGPFTYTWSHDAGLQTETASSLAAATYDISVTDGVCSKDTTIILGIVNNILVNPTIVQPSCLNNDGQISLVPSPGGPFTYIWSHDALLTVETANSLPEGTYDISITDGLCSKDTTIILTIGEVLFANATVVQANCGEANGSIAFNPSPSGVHTFTWSHDNALTDASATNLGAATYDVNISLGACSKDTTIILTPSVLFKINGALTQDVTCAQNDGEITLNPEPNGAYTFVWQHDAGNSSNIASAIPDGSYFVTVSDGVCQKDTTIVLAAPIGCCTIVLDGNLSTTINTVCEGTSNPCNYSGPTILINEINIFPSNGDGSIFGDGPGGPGSGAGEWIELYNPDWCNSVDISGYILGSFNSTFSVNPPLQSDGMGFVLPDGLIVPPNGFVVVRGINTNAPPAGVIDVVVDNVDNRLCIDGGIADSRIWFQNAGGWFGFYDANGVPQDMITWNAPTLSDLDGRPCIPATNSLPVGFTQLPTFNEAGINNVLGAPSLGQTFVRIPDGGAWSATSQDENSSYGACNVPGGCNGNGGAFSTCNGSATLNITNGQAPFTYLWNDDLAQDTQTADSLCAGTYSVAVTDANGCTNTFNVTVDDEFLTISATSIDPTCANNDGTIDVVATPNGVYDYTWSANANVGNNTTSNVSTLAAGTYTISVSSPTCVRDTTITLTSPPQITDIVTNVTSSLCAQNNGAIQLGAVTGGTSPFSYNFNNQGSGANTNFTSLSAGNYSVVVEDANGCSYQEAIVVSDDSSNPPTQAVFDNLEPSCLNNDGQIEISNVIGGVAPYSYQLNGAASTTTAIFAALASGNYAINIEDANGCSMIANTTLTAPPAITDLATTVTNSTCAQNNGQVLLGAVSGGTQPYTYNFNNQGSSTNQSFSDLVAGSYPVTVQDANFCTYQETIVVVDNSSNPPTQANFDVINPGCGQSNGEIEILNIVGGVAPYSYQFNNGTFSTNTNYENLGLGSYSLLVEDANGCQYQTQINITTAIGNENVVIPNVFTPSDDLVNQEWQIKGECVQSAECQIFNRWGNLIHEFNDINGKWDGKTNGDQVQEGVYFYKLIVIYSSGLVVDYHGNITLIKD